MNRIITLSQISDKYGLNIPTRDGCIDANK